MICVDALKSERNVGQIFEFTASEKSFPRKNWMREFFRLQTYAMEHVRSAFASEITLLTSRPVHLCFQSFLFQEFMFKLSEVASLIKIWILLKINSSPRRRRITKLKIHISDQVYPLQIRVLQDCDRRPKERVPSTRKQHNWISVKTAFWQCQNTRDDR